MSLYHESWDSLLYTINTSHTYGLHISISGSLLNIGAMVGSVSSGPLMVWLGQRMTLLCTLPVAAFGWFLLAFSSQVWPMQVARILLGIVVGVFGGPSANFVAEISHSSVRGRLTGLVDLFRQLGFLFVYVIGSSGLTWRETCIVCGIVTTIIPFGALWFLPNSPRWLATKSRNDEARRSLKFYRGEEYCIDVELTEISNQLKSSNKGSSVKNQLKTLQEHSIVKRMILLCFLFFAYQFTGNFSMIMFSVTIFQSVEGSFNEYTSTIIVGIVRVFAVLSYILVADRVGRRPTLISSLVLSSLSIGSLGGYFYFQSAGYSVDSIHWMPLVTLAVFIYFTCVAEPVLILLRGELLPTAVRSLGVSIIYIFFFSGAFLVSYLFPLMMNDTGAHGTFWTYALDSCLMAVVVAMFIPETKSKSLEDIQLSYKKEDDNET